MLDLALGTDGMASCYFLVAPDRREADVRAQFARPAFSRVAELNLRYLPYSDLETPHPSIPRFGQGLKPIEAITRDLHYTHTTPPWPPWPPPQTHRFFSP